MRQTTRNLIVFIIVFLAVILIGYAFRKPFIERIRSLGSTDTQQVIITQRVTPSPSPTPVVKVSPVAVASPSSIASITPAPTKPEGTLPASGPTEVLVLSVASGLLASASVLRNRKTRS